MAENDKVLTWKDKLNKGLPLNNLEETQADADFNYRRRLREEEETREYNKLKAGYAQPSDQTPEQRLAAASGEERKTK
jgi:hypothetical protein